MTQVSIQTTGFELTQALSNTCQQAAAKLALSETQRKKLEIFTQILISDIIRPLFAHADHVGRQRQPQIGRRNFCR